MDDGSTLDASWWTPSVEQTLQAVGSSTHGLGRDDAAARLRRYGPNTLEAEKSSRLGSLLLRQISSPIVIVLIAAAILSFVIGDTTDSIIILFIVVVSGALASWQEYRAAAAVSDLQHIVAVQAEVLRDGAVTKVPREEVVPGDVVLLSAGASIPADCRLLETRDLFVNEATLTGETFPVEKTPSDLPADTPLAGRSNALFQGTDIVSGIGRALVVRTGRNTQFGAIAERLRIRPQETDFERGVRQFGMLLIRVTLILVILIFAFNVYLHRPVLDSFLFALGARSRPDP